MNPDKTGGKQVRPAFYKIPFDFFVTECYTI